MQKAIVSGATGAVGTALVQALTEQNIAVLVLVRPGSARNGALPHSDLVRLLPCDLENLAALENTTGESYDVFYHLAWQGTVGAAREDMHLQNRNVKYALDAVQVAARFGCRRFVGVGSQAEYGRVEGLLRPDTPAFPEMGYGMGKLCAGLMTRSLAKQLGMEHIWVRILSIYGPNDGPNSMVMSAIARLKAGIPPEMTGAEQLWDYLYSGDGAQALRLLGDRGISGSTYVLGSGQARPLKEYVEIIRQLTAPECAVHYGALPYGPRQVMHLQADISELTRDTGWLPQTAFAAGIAQILRSQE